MKTWFIAAAFCIGLYPAWAAQPPATQDAAIPNDAAVAAGPSSPASGMGASPSQPGAAVPPAARDVLQGATSDVLRATLPNGLRVVIVPDHLAPVVTTELSYLVGSNDAPPGFPGTAHALEHMMFRGSEGLDKDQLAEVGALLGGIYNADTTETATRYTYTVPATDLSIPLKIEALRMRGLTLSEADWDNERGAIEQEVAADLSNPFYNYLSQAQSILFQGTPYEHDALGTRESFDRTDAALLRRFYDAWYAPNNAILVVAGDVDAAKALAQVRQEFGAIPSHKLPDHAPVHVGPVQAKTLDLPTDFPAGLVALAYRMPGQTDPDFAAADILADVLGSERGAIYGLVPAGKALMAQFAYRAKRDVGFGLALGAFPTGDDPQPLLAELRKAIADIATNGVPAELVAAVKRRELAQLGFEANSIRGLASTWSRALALRNADSPDDIAKAYAAVTVADVNRLAKRLLDPQQAITAILTPRQAGKPVSQAAFGAESFAAAPEKPVVLPDWAAHELMSVHVPDLGQAPSVSVLPNGIRLIVQPEHVSHTISVFGRVRQVPQMQQPNGKEGVSLVMRALFGYGTSQHDRLAFQAASDDIAATIQAGPNFALQVLTPAFEPGLRLLAEAVLHPAFPNNAFNVVRAQVARSIAGQLHSPQYLFRLAIERAILPEDDPVLRHPTPESVMALGPEDVRAYYDATMRPDLTTIVVLGDITPEAARQAIEAAFGGWHAEGPAPDIDLPPVGPNKPSQAHVADAGDQHDSVALAEIVGLPIGSQERYRLLLGNTILGSGFSSRLYRDLRIHSGYVYSVSSDFDWSRTRADYSVSFGADPQNVEKARAAVLWNLKQMQTAPVPEGELTRAKAELLRQLQMQRASIGAVASQYLRLSELGLPLDAAARAANAYAAITAEEVRDAFAHWVRPDDLAVVFKGP